MLWETIRLALRSIRRNVLRSFLTLLGIVIGVAAVIAMITIGGGTTEKVKSDISQLGSNLLVVRAARPDRSGSTSFTPRKLDEKDVAGLVSGLTTGARGVGRRAEARCASSSARRTSQPTSPAPTSPISSPATGASRRAACSPNRKRAAAPMSA